MKNNHLLLILSIFCAAQLHSFEIRVADIDNLENMPLETINNIVTHYSDVEKLLLTDFQKVVEQTLVALPLDLKNPHQTTATLLATATALGIGIKYALNWVDRSRGQCSDNETYKTLYSDWSLPRQHATCVLDSLIYNVTNHTCPSHFEAGQKLRTKLNDFFLDPDFCTPITAQLGNIFTKFNLDSRLHSNEISKLGVIVSLRTLPRIFEKKFKNAYDAAFDFLTDDTIRNSDEIIEMLHNYSLRQCGESRVNHYLELIHHIFFPAGYHVKSARKVAS